MCEECHGAGDYENMHRKVKLTPMNNSPIVCYCKNVTEAEIIEHVANRRCCSTIEDIQKHTGANTGAECHTKNPAGT